VVGYDAPTSVDPYAAASDAPPAAYQPPLRPAASADSTYGNPEVPDPPPPTPLSCPTGGAPSVRIDDSDYRVTYESSSFSRSTTYRVRVVGRVTNNASADIELTDMFDKVTVYTDDKKLDVRMFGSVVRTRWYLEWEATGSYTYYGDPAYFRPKITAELGTWEWADDEQQRECRVR